MHTRTYETLMINKSHIKEVEISNIFFCSMFCPYTSVAYNHLLLCNNINMSYFMILGKKVDKQKIKDSIYLLRSETTVLPDSA